MRRTQLLSLYCLPLIAACLLGRMSAAQTGRESGSPPRFELWNSRTPQPAAAACLPLPEVSIRPIKAYEPARDGYHWLHGIALAWFRDRLFVSFGHNRGSENTAGEEARFVTSADWGQTWSPVNTIDAGDEENLAISHGVFLVEGERLFAFQGAFYGKLQDVHTRGYEWNPVTQAWQPLGIVVPDGFWPMQQPIRVAGTWVMAGLHVVDGLSRFDDSAAVAVSSDEDFTTWELVVLPKPDQLDLWGESTVLAVSTQPDASPDLWCISRYRQPRALVATSQDLGRTWTQLQESNLLMAASKPYAGTLPDGRHYLIGTTTADSGNRRSPLTLALSPPGKPKFERVFQIRDALLNEVPLPPAARNSLESGQQHRLSYPYAIVHDNQLLVGYSNDGGRGGNRNSAELAIIPLSALD